MKKFDLIIIGGGAGAFAAAIRANELGAKTALINAGLPLGGTCVNVGCLPSKTLLWAGEIMHSTKHHGIPGIDIEVKNFDFQKVVQDELALVEKMRREKYEKVLKNLEHVSAIEGKAKFVSEKEVEVNGETLNAEKIIIATGSTANVPPIEGIHEVGFVTHIEALKMDKQPKELIVIGAGPVGLEFAQMFARFGTKVIVLQRGPSILPQVEKPLTDRLTEVLKKEGVTIITSAEITKVYAEGDPSTKLGVGKKVVAFTVDGREQTAKGDKILLAAGKTANTGELGLDLAGVEIDKRQTVVVNQNFQTSAKNIFAVGDVTNAPMRLETTAGREGTLAAENALKGTTLFIDYDTVPFTVFTDPQIAGVGTSESRQMKEQGVCNCRTISFEAVPKAIIMHRTEGLIHMAVDTKSPKIVGMQILAPNAGELIAIGMMIVKNGNTIDDVVNSLPMFPTLSESIKIAALSFTKDISKLSCCI
ncbi:MAG: mercury(II) reductase [Candidatus Roizmanbacteria bacterium]|nr:mercury(II) reductase [Candidatus Roizmanbacteria bacterium]